MARISGSVFNLDYWQLTQSHVRHNPINLSNESAQSRF